MKKNWKIFYVIGLVLLFISLMNNSTNTDKKSIGKELIFSEFLSDMKNKKIKAITIKDNIVSGKIETAKGVEEEFHSTILVYPELLETIGKSEIPTTIIMPKENGFNMIKMIDIISTLLWIVILFLIFKSMRGDKFGFSKNNIKMFTSDMQKIKFKDVLGIDEVKQEVAEIVDFLQDSKKYSRLGAKIPKGVLLIGSPGTGKTLLARAIAGEAGVPFFSTSGSEFVEMFVGVGASRVRTLFEQAKKNAPCLVFIDEIDAVGRHRGAGHGGGNDEREQTLNQLLVEMDGFEINNGIIVVAATNRSDVLDTALLRPGRFDRQVYIPLPDLIGRQAILEKYISEVNIQTNFDISFVARGTPGFSGAELANLVNEAAIQAARKNKKQITFDDFEYARDKIIMGLEHKSKTMSKDEIKNTAYHEAGHALCSVLLPNLDPIHKATIIPRGQALGLVQHLPERDKISINITEIKSTIAMSLAGRIAEELIFGKEKITTGASSDIMSATQYAQKSITEWGFSPSLGMVFYGNRDESPISENLAKQIDTEVADMIKIGYKTAYDILTTHRDKLDLLASSLLEYETLTGDEVRDLVNGKTLKLIRKKDLNKRPFNKKSSIPLTDKKEIKNVPSKKK